MKFLNQIDGAKDLVQDSNNRLVTDTEKSTWNSKSDTDTVTTVNGKTGAIAKADIVALGIPAQDTVYTHPASHPASMITDLPTGKKVVRFVVGTSTAGWTTVDCDYLCDGTDDETEINAAIIALPATGGEVVILDGTYNITDKVDVTKDNVSIRGNGNATILKRMYDSFNGEGVIMLAGRSGCKISNLQVDGNAHVGFGIRLDSSSNNTVTGNTCTSNDSSGIGLISSSNNTITGNTSNNNGDGGIFIYDSSNNNTVTSNTCDNNGIGINLVNSSYANTITGNTCNNNGTSGLYLNNSENNTITGNTSNNNDYGLRIDMSSNNTVTGNIYNNNDHGIFLSSSNNNTITGNTCIRGTGLATDYTESQHTIRLRYADSNYNLISNNNCMGKAPVIEGGTGNSVYSNKYDSGDYKDFTQDEKTKLAGIAASANNYTHPTTAGNKHIPTGGASGQILRYSASGTAIWGADNDTITTINGKTGTIAKADIVALGVPAQDTVYTHPANHPASIITQDASNRFVTDTEKATWNAKGTSNLTLGTTSLTAFRGDYGNTAYAHSQSAHAPSGAQVNQTLTSGNGMAAWTATNGNLTIPLGTPSTLTTATTNAVTTTSHTHSVTFPVTSVAGKTGAVTLGPTDVGAAASTHSHGTYDREAAALTGANVFSDLVVEDGIVTGISTRALTPANIGAAAATHTHAYVPTTRTVNSKALSANIVLTAADVGAAASTHAHGAYDRSTSALTGANVFSDLVVVDGIVTGISTRALTLANLGYTGATNANYYTHPSGDGNLHVPATSTTNSGKVLKAGSTAGSLSWATDNDTITTINGKTGAITKADITALGIPAQDTVYTHPASHPASIITQNASNRFVTDTEKATWNAKGTSNLALGTTSSTAYRGDYGDIAYAHSQATHAPTNAVANQTLTSGSGMAAWTATSGNLTITLGTPSTLTTATTNAVTTTSHTHSVTFPVTSVAGKTGAVTLGPTDVGAAPSSHTHAYVPTSRTVNGKALSANISLTAADVGAAASSHSHSYLPLSGGTLTGDLNLTDKDIWINTTNNDRFLYFKYITGPGYSWRLGYLGTGSSNANYFTLETDDADGVWEKVFTVGLTTKIMDFIATPTVSGSSILTATNYNSYAPTKTGIGASGSWGISVTGSSASCTGNAASATKAATLTTARTLTIGSTGKTFNGSANVSWSLAEIGAAPASHTHSYVPTTRTVNGKALSANISLTAADVGAAATSHGNHVPTTGTANNAIFLRNDNTWQTVTPANIGAAPSSHTHAYVPTSRTVNGKALSANITLTAANVGAAATSHGNHVPTTGTASNKIFLRNDNTWQTITPANIGAAPSSHTHAYVPTTRTVNSKALSANISLTAADVGAAATSHGNHVPTTGTANSAIFLRNDNTWQTVTPANIGAAPSSHTHAYVPTSRTVNGKALSANISLTAANVGAAASSHTHSYLPLSGGTVTGGITKTTTPSSWISGKTATNVLYFGSVTQSSYHPMIRVNSYSGHVWNLGGLGNSVGFYGFYSSSTTNKTEWSTYWDTASGTLTHSTTFAVGGNIYEGGTALVNKYAAKSHTHSYVPTSRTVNGKALSANISLTAANVGAAATSHSHTVANITDLTGGIVASGSGTNNWWYKLTNGTIVKYGFVSLSTPMTAVNYVAQSNEFTITYNTGAPFTVIPTVNVNGRAADYSSWPAVYSSTITGFKARLMARASSGARTWYLHYTAIGR